MAVPNVPFWISQAHAEAKTSGWTSSAINALQVFTPGWCSSMAGRTYATRSTLTVGTLSGTTPPVNARGYSLSNGSPSGIAFGALSGSVHEGITIQAFYRNSLQSTNSIYFQFSANLPAAMKVRIYTTIAGANSTYEEVTLNSGFKSGYVRWDRGMTLINENSTMTVEFLYT